MSKRLKPIAFFLILSSFWSPFWALSESISGFEKTEAVDTVREEYRIYRLDRSEMFRSTQIAVLEVPMNTDYLVALIWNEPIDPVDKNPTLDPNSVRAIVVEKQGSQSAHQMNFYREYPVDDSLDSILHQAPHGQVRGLFVDLLNLRDVTRESPGSTARKRLFASQLRRVVGGLSQESVALFPSGCSHKLDE